MPKNDKNLKNFSFPYVCGQIPRGGIAFFDSGIGGLTVLSACRKYLPNEVFYYYGDNTRAPYGNQPPEKICTYVEEAFAFFLSLQVRAVVLACNTATAVCADFLRQKYAFPIIGAEPAVQAAARVGKKILVLSTKATGESHRFGALCERVRKNFPNTEIASVLCERLAGEIERHISEPDFSYASCLPVFNPDVVVLGCTHYIYIKEYIQSFYGCKTLDGNDGIARRLHFLLSGNQFAPVVEKNWDGQPLSTTPPQSKGGFCPQNAPFSPIIQENVSPENVTQTAPIFFLGACSGYNLRIFEQMFGK